MRTPIHAKRLGGNYTPLIELSVCALNSHIHRGNSRISHATPAPFPLRDVCHESKTKIASRPSRYARAPAGGSSPFQGRIRSRVFSPQRTRFRGFSLSARSWILARVLRQNFCTTQLSLMVQASNSVANLCNASFGFDNFKQKN